jgi:hypothetical protein
MYLLLMEMRPSWKWNGENTASIDCLARGEEGEKERRESYHTWRFYHIVMPQRHPTIVLLISLRPTDYILYIF